MTYANHRIGLLWAVCAAFASGACSEPPEKWWHERVHTQITLVIDADETVRAAVDTLRIEIYAGEAREHFPTFRVHE